MALANCPYCRASIELSAPPSGLSSALTCTCPVCLKPIAVYATRAYALQHTDRAIRPLVVQSEEAERGEVAWLEFVDNQFAHRQVLPLPLGIYTLGRANKDSTAELQLLCSDPSMGRYHLKIRHSKGLLTVQDNESNTGTFINGRLLGPKEHYRLRDGDVITLGAMSAIAHYPKRDEEEDELEVDLDDFDIE